VLRRASQASFDELSPMPPSEVSVVVVCTSRHRFVIMGLICGFTVENAWKLY
jgi:hypothetical protein